MIMAKPRLACLSRWRINSVTKSGSVTCALKCEIGSTKKVFDFQILDSIYLTREHVLVAALLFRRWHVDAACDQHS
jgi:hypothetical protein